MSLNEQSLLNSHSVSNSIINVSTTVPAPNPTISHANMFGNAAASIIHQSTSMENKTMFHNTGAVTSSAASSSISANAKPYNSSKLTTIVRPFELSPPEKKHATLNLASTVPQNQIMNNAHVTTSKMTTPQGLTIGTPITSIHKNLPPYSLTYKDEQSTSLPINNIKNEVFSTANSIHGLSKQFGSSHIPPKSASAGSVWSPILTEKPFLKTEPIPVGMSIAVSSTAAIGNLPATKGSLINNHLSLIPENKLMSKSEMKPFPVSNLVPLSTLVGTTSAKTVFHITSSPLLPTQASNASTNLKIANTTLTSSSMIPISSLTNSLTNGSMSLQQNPSIISSSLVNNASVAVTAQSMSQLDIQNASPIKSHALNNQQQVSTIYNVVNSQPYSANKYVSSITNVSSHNVLAVANNSGHFAVPNQNKKTAFSINSVSSNVFSSQSAIPALTVAFSPGQTITSTHFSTSAAAATTNVTFTALHPATVMPNQSQNVAIIPHNTTNIKPSSNIPTSLINVPQQTITYFPQNIINLPQSLANLTQTIAAAGGTLQTSNIGTGIHELPTQAMTTTTDQSSVQFSQIISNETMNTGAGIANVLLPNNPGSQIPNYSNLIKVQGGAVINNIPSSIAIINNCHSSREIQVNRSIQISSTISPPISFIPPKIPTPQPPRSPVSLLDLRAKQEAAEREQERLESDRREEQCKKLQEALKALEEAHLEQQQQYQQSVTPVKEESTIKKECKTDQPRSRKEELRIKREEEKAAREEAKNRKEEARQKREEGMRVIRSELKRKLIEERRGGVKRRITILHKGPSAPLDITEEVSWK